MVKPQVPRLEPWVVLGPEGGPEVEFEGARYPSLSAAAKAVTGHSTNGWRFWRSAGVG